MNSFMTSPVSHCEVLLLLQGVDERDQEVLVVEQGGEQGDALLHVGPRRVGGLRVRRETEAVVSSQRRFSSSAPHTRPAPLFAASRPE